MALRGMSSFLTKTASSASSDSMPSLTPVTSSGSGYSNTGKVESPIWTEPLNKIFNDLKQRNEEIRFRAGKQLYNYVSNMIRDMPAESFAKFMSDLNTRISYCVHSTSIIEKSAAVTAIDDLIDVDFDDNENANQISKFGHLLRVALTSTDTQILYHASKALGRLVRTGSTLPEFSETVDIELSKALDWLRQTERYEPRRYAAVLVLKELAVNSPTLFNVHVSAFVDLVWVALTDTSITIREAAGEALRACLDVIAARENTLRSQWYGKLFAEAQKGFKQKDSTPAAHGSLIVVGEMLVNTGDFLEEHFREICEVVLERKDSAQKPVRKAVISLLPKLASFSSSIFVKDYLNTSVNYLLTIVKKDNNDRGKCFLALGEISIAVGGNIKPFLDSILGAIKSGLQTKKKAEFCAEALTCLGMISMAVGPALRSYMEDMLGEMFNAGLSETLTEALATLGKHIPAIMPDIQEQLLNYICSVLGHKSFSEPEMGRVRRTPSSGQVPEYIHKEQKPSSDDSDIMAAISTLGNFNFRTNTNVKNFDSFLEDLVKDSVISYLDSDNATIRRESAKTSASLVSSNSQKSSIIMSDILEKLLITGITDRDASIRRVVLKSLKDKKFDNLLAQPENLRSLFMALNDEVFEVRELAITIIGRLTIKNPAYVMPSLRKTLIQLLGDLQFGGDSRKKEESSRLLSKLILASRNLLKPYVETIANVLMPKLNEDNAHVASCVLATLGELATAGGEEMRPYLKKLIPLIIDKLQDQSSTSKREVALSTLGKLASSTGYIISPFLDYPQLLDILLHIVKSESSKPTRREAIKVLGILGALDPFKYKMNQLKLKGDPQEGATGKQEQEDSLEGDIAGESTNEKYYPTVVINALVKIMRDPSLSSHYRSVIDALIPILKSLGIKGAPAFLPQVMPPYLAILRRSEPSFRIWLFQELGVLVGYVKYNIRNYLDEIFELILENWSSNALNQIVTLVEDISKELKEEFKVFLPDLIPPMLTVLHQRQQGTKKILHALEVFGDKLKDYLHLVIPAVANLLDVNEVESEIPKLALNTLARLCKDLNFSDYASRIIHPIMRLLDISAPDPKSKEFIVVGDTRKAAFEALCALIYQLGSDYAIFIPMVNKVLLKQNISDTHYETLMGRLMKNQPLIQDEETYLDQNSDGTTRRRESDQEGSSRDQVPLTVNASVSVGVKLRVDLTNLKQHWEASQRSTKEDWAEWIRRFSMGLLRESPSPALRSCLTLAQDYFPLVRELFNAGFISCWRELDENSKADLVLNLEKALTSPNMEILQTLLNLAEFMEHEDEPLPLKRLGILAERCHAYAKALYYKEEEFLTSPSTTVESLISLNNQLGQPRAAEGILKFAEENHRIELLETWFEKLHRWDEALAAYNRRVKEGNKSIDVVYGQIKCLHALGDWETLEQRSQEYFVTEEDDPNVAVTAGSQPAPPVQNPNSENAQIRNAIAPLAAAAAWNMSNWETMEKAVQAIDETSYDGIFYRAVLAIHRNEFEQAQRFIDQSRDILDADLVALIGESYDRAYKSLVRVQQLAELEEIISYKQSSDYQERQEMLKQIWTDRLLGCQRNVDTWQDLLGVRSLVLDDRENMKNWLKFASLSRQGRRKNMSGKILTKLMSISDATPGSLPAPLARYGHIKHLWAIGKQQEAFNELRSFAPSIRDDQILKARGYQKLGDWQKFLEPLEQTVNPEIIKSFKYATELDSNWYKAWHSWAMVNFEAVAVYEKAGTPQEGKAQTHLIPAIKGFFRSIALSPALSLQDTLRLLTLWFKYGNQKEVESALMEGFGTVSIDNWLQVIPQIIARIAAPNTTIRRLIHELLINVGKEHPQALVFPLNVALKSQSPQRIAAAKSVMENLRKHSASLVEQALMVSDELVRVAILWNEMWHEGLEDASRFHFAEHNTSQAISRLKPLHEMLSKGPETLVEAAFQQAHGRDLQEALEWTFRYEESGQISDFNQAWDLYYNVFKQIKQAVQNLSALDLGYVSPKLLAARDLELAVPGSYRAGEPITKISSFNPALDVIQSKQHPRRLALTGSDGYEYRFLLKGHEDLRQDERVMQLFGLVNTLLASEFETSRNHLSIQRYSVVPLAPNSGLIGWLSHCDTLHALIRAYRDAKKIPYTLEQRILLQMSSDYANLCTVQKVEIFKHAIETTDGNDLKKILWLRSGTAEVWLDRRTNFTRSLALMSMVGYILGLGDRHCSNIMVDRITGKIIHIDFGDCFEVAMLRDKFPEKVPFRLTRMLISAMGVSGIEGNFRATCESVMRVLRENKESLMAVLEAFVADPLIGWRLLTPNDSRAREDSQSSKNKNLIEEAEGYATNSLAKDKLAKSITTDEAEAEIPEVLNEKALAITMRISNKLTGKDFQRREEESPLDVNQQVHRLIKQATDVENLCQSYLGWSPYW